MSAKLCLFCCGNFQQEVRASVEQEGWQDVTVAHLPARCGKPPLSWEEIRAQLPEDCSHAVILGRACLSDLAQPPADGPTLKVIRQEQCFYLVAAPALVDEAIAGGAYLITPGWLSDWQGQLAHMGFSVSTAGEFFHDFAKELVLLDTGIDPEAMPNLAQMAQVVGLPSRRIPVGLDHVRLNLARAVLEWRLQLEHESLEQRERTHRRECADQMLAMDLLAQIAKVQQEPAVIASIGDLFGMLFAPGVWHYLRVERGQMDSDREVPPEYLEPLRQLSSAYAWTPSGNGFFLRLAQGEEVLGLAVVDQLAFPEFRHRYLNLALAMTGVFALAIENARNRKRLVEAEKMGSLGVMVAGVAHEINTPLGVGLTAASSLQDRSQNLADRFAERRMTQSDLQNYLQCALQEAGLIRTNLERIGRVTEAFRQVAVAGKLPGKRGFSPRTCLEDVVSGLGERLSIDQINVQIHCPDDLEIESYPGDWASIFTNLISNSLRHGFKEREHGSIEIAVARKDNSLMVDYWDDGVGLSESAKTRIFDPFFTTDLQRGMGLGMHLVYNLITHRFGGSIVCDHSVSRGVHFHIETPL
ncbi:ATP-binding protein [Methyloterricola oryzae]|uniref:ATP-binding protein n=1 Tax=Methyloterricola oryzae TaxID=1495050 RepID=UPI00069AE23E|nr:ATP-binding protein [Methyloterricola oryzae]